MKVRLAFSVVSQLEEPILLVDEVLAVGDKAFREKCYRRIDELLADGRTLFFVSHSERDLRRFCTRGLYLDKGAAGDGCPDRRGARPLQRRLPDRLSSGRPSPPRAAASAARTASFAILRPSRRPRNRLLVPRTVRSTSEEADQLLANVRAVPAPKRTGL